MGPFDIDRQLARRESVKRLLDQPNLPESARDLWCRVLNNIALDEHTYNERVRETYRNHRKELVEWNP